MNARHFIAIFIATAVPLGARAQPPKIDFAHDIVPILKARCAECHTNGKRKGDVALDTREDALKSKAITPGKSATSALIERVKSTEADKRMPPKGPPLTAAEIAKLATWIDRGAIAIHHSMVL